MINNGRHFFVLVFVFLAIFLTGCTVTGRPRFRPGCCASSTLPIGFLDRNSLGKHNYNSFLGEGNGIVYTCSGGHIDIAHVRIAADNVYYLYCKFRKELQAKKTELVFKLNTDPSVFVFHITYPLIHELNSAAEQQKIIDDVALELAQYGTWYMVTWHEVLTWFGLKVCYIIPQFRSAFAWEDSYSNLLGTTLGARAIRQFRGDFNKAMTAVIRDELENLSIQSAEIAYYASDKMHGEWFNWRLTILLRNLDIGADDGFVSPVQVPGICVGASPVSYPIPTLDTARRYDFGVQLEIEPRRGVTNRCRDLIYPDGNYGLILPDKHLPILMGIIRQQAIERGYQVTP